MQRGEVDLVVVGADRIARNGDVANKVGTYPLAVLAREHRIPFYVAAPLATVDFETPGVGVRHPAFDVTPAHLVAAIITERGIARPDYTASLAALRC